MNVGEAGDANKYFVFEAAEIQSFISSVTGGRNVTSLLKLLQSRPGYIDALKSNVKLIINCQSIAERQFPLMVPESRPENGSETLRRRFHCESKDI